MYLTILLNFLSTYFICSIFENLFIFFIVLFALIILNCEVLSIFHIFNSKSILAVSFFDLAASGLFWFKFSKKLYIPKINKSIFNAIKLDKSLLIFSIFFIFMLICTFFLAIYSLPIEPDSRMYHFVRIIEYIKQGSFNHFETNLIRNIIMPFNSEMIYSYFYIFKNNEFSFGLLSYFSFIFLIFGMYGIFTELKIPIRKAFFSIFTFSSLAPVLVQIPSLQTDLVIANLTISSIYLFILSQNKKSNTILYFSSLSYALALGTKTTAIMNFLPFFIIIAGYILIYKKPMKNIPIFIFYLVLNFTIFSSYNYILNFIDFGNFIAPISFQIEHKPENIIYNFITLSKSFIHSKAGFVYDERTTGFSILGIIIILPTIIVSFLNFLKKNKKYKIISLFTISAFLNFILLSSSMTYFKYSVRFFVVYVAICAFSFSFFYKKRLNIYKIAITCICAVNLVLYPLYSTRCPLYCYLRADFKNLKEDLILNRQNVNMLKFQYMILKEFEQKFKKEDKILVLNKDELYEIIRLPDYNIKTVSFDYIKNSNLKDFDYIITLDNEQSTDSPEHLTLEGVNKDYTYNIATKKYKNKNYIIAKKYIFNDSFFEKKGFKLTEKTVLFKTYKKM